MRRASGAVYSSTSQSSPKLRAKTPSEETWHSTACRHYLQEYVQYLHTVGFISLQTSENDKSQSSIQDDRIPRSDSFTRYRNSVQGVPYYLIKCFLGGMLVFELGLSDPYAYGYVYSLECSRFNACSTRPLSNQFTGAFLDELDKVMQNMNLHSFTYDYHLRTIHSYISGRQLIFRHGYHISSFLEDFIKYYQKVPNGARNLVFSGSLEIPDVNMSGDQLYNYIIGHNKLYGMSVLRMVPIIIDNSCIDTEFALVELSTEEAQYRDINDDLLKKENFDVGILINKSNSDLDIDMKSLVLNFYIILTSQRDPYPHLMNFSAPRGSFHTVRVGTGLSSSGQSSRKTSTVSMEKEKFESSEDSTTSSGSRSKKLSSVRGMCDEDVMYLGYYSSQETMMQKVLSQQAGKAKDHLQAVVQRASVHCRRDSLWSSLLPRTLRDDSRDHSFSSSSIYHDFYELLDLVNIVPLSDLDEALTPFMNMHITWYASLVQVLKSKYADCHREFKSPDNHVIFVVVTDSKCPDSFMLLQIDTKSNNSEISLVFRESPNSIDSNSDTDGILNVTTTALQALVEEFVNACCFHLWTCIL